ncbi:MAG TPA: hypothetical protein VJR05_10155 [Acidimicrobiia bacterium]|nr:hypothetical protein [Acidimicrobiia bacterium]
MRRLSLLMAMVLLVPMPAFAGGSWLDTPDEFIELGEEVELVGYVGLGTSTDWSQRGFAAYLNLTPSSEGETHFVRVAPVEIRPTGLGGYLSHRVYVRFTVPTDIDPGVYAVSVQGPEGEGLGDLIGAFLTLGQRGPLPQNIEWPLDEPLIALLPDYATITGPGFAVLVGELRAGRYPAGAHQFLLDPSVLEQPGVVTIPSTTPAYVTSTTAAVTAATTALPTASTSAPAPSFVPRTVPTAGQPGVPLVLLIASGLVILVALAGGIALAARRREVLVVLDRLPVATPFPTDGGEGFDDYVAVDDQTRH